MMQNDPDRTLQARPVETIRPIRKPADHCRALAEVVRSFAQEPAGRDT